MSKNKNGSNGNGGKGGGGRKTTSPSIATIAAKGLSTGKLTSAEIKRLSGSALSQDEHPQK